MILPDALRDKMLNVIIESPFRANTTHSEDTHVQYALRCLADSLSRGEAPIASHLLYTQVLDDSDPQARA